jgi:hypothetical protein
MSGRRRVRPEDYVVTEERAIWENSPDGPVYLDTGAPVGEPTEAGPGDEEDEDDDDEGLAELDFNDGRRY